MDLVQEFSKALSNQHDGKRINKLFFELTRIGPILHSKCKIIVTALLKTINNEA